MYSVFSVVYILAINHFEQLPRVLDGDVRLAYAEECFDQVKSCDRVRRICFDGTLEVAKAPARRFGSGRSSPLELE